MALLALPASASAEPADVQRLRELASLVEVQSAESSPSASKITAKFMAELLTRTKEIAAQNGLPASIGLDGGGFAKQLKARIEGPVEKALAMPRAERRTELYKLLADITQQEEAHNQLALWLNTDPMSTYAKAATDAAEAERVAALEAERTRDAEARGDRPLTTAERIAEARLQVLESARADQAVLAERLNERFRRTLSVAQADGDLRLLPNEAVLVDDRGGPGTRNGIADAGEWVTVSLPIVNAGRTPWFSSSAYVRTDSDCL
ncbi:MAG: hypothetical protein FJ090_14610, partial [Deltaproteobacteria bacterium]|nr:hypothetical protein [Deltaproteobacteria bacterium]